MVGPLQQFDRWGYQFIDGYHRVSIVFTVLACSLRSAFFGALGCSCGVSVSERTRARPYRLIGEFSSSFCELRNNVAREFISCSCCCERVRGTDCSHSMLGYWRSPLTLAHQEWPLWPETHVVPVFEYEGGRFGLRASKHIWYLEHY